MFKNLYQIFLTMGELLFCQLSRGGGGGSWGWGQIFGDLMMLVFAGVPWVLVCLLSRSNDGQKSTECREMPEMVKFFIFGKISNIWNKKRFFIYIWNQTNIDIWIKQQKTPF